MKQGGAESRGSETRTLERLLMKYERDTRLESIKAFIMHSRLLPLLPVVLMCCKAALFYHTRYIIIIMLLCAFVTCLIKCITY